MTQLGASAIDLDFDALRGEAVAEAAVDWRFGCPERGEHFASFADVVELRPHHPGQHTFAAMRGTNGDPRHSCRGNRPAGDCQVEAKDAGGAHDGVAVEGGGAAIELAMLAGVARPRRVGFEVPREAVRLRLEEGVDLILRDRAVGNRHSGAPARSSEPGKSSAGELGSEPALADPGFSADGRGQRPFHGKAAQLAPARGREEAVHAVARARSFDGRKRLVRRRVRCRSARTRSRQCAYQPPPPQQSDSHHPLPRDRYDRSMTLNVHKVLTFLRESFGLCQRP